MQINFFDPETRIFTHQQEGMPDPRNEGEFLTIAFSTSDPLPTLPEGHVAVRSGTDPQGDSWVVTEDRRGQIFNTTTKEESSHTELGPLPAGFTHLVPGDFDEFNGNEWVYSTQLEIAAVLPVVISEINTACKAAIEGGFVSNALGQDYTYDSQLEDQVNIGGNVQMGIDVLHKRIDSNGDAEYVVHTAAEMRQVGEALVAHKLTQLTKAALLKGQAKAAAEAIDLAALQAITWS